MLYSFEDFKLDPADPLSLAKVTIYLPTRRAVRPCLRCGFFATADLCDICADSSRSSELLCVVEQATDMVVGVFHEARIHFHLPAQDGLQRHRHVVPTGDFGMPRG